MPDKSTQPPAITESDRDPQWPWQLHCPVCGSEYNQHYNVQIFKREDEYGFEREDGPSVFYQGALGPRPTRVNPSPRRGAVRVYFHCEAAEHDWCLDIIQHKSVTYLRTMPV